MCVLRQVMAADSPPDEGRVVIKAPGHITDPILEDEETKEGGVMAEGEKTEPGADVEENEKPSEKLQKSAEHSSREVYPATFSDLCIQITERASFLLEVSTCRCTKEAWFDGVCENTGSWMPLSFTLHIPHFTFLVFLDAASW